MADNYSSTYTSTYGEGAVDTAVVNLVATQVSGRPTFQLTVTNNDTVPVTIVVTRTQSVAGRAEVRYLYKVSLNPGNSVAALDDEAPIGVPFEYNLTAGGQVFDTEGPYTLSGPWTTLDGLPSWAWLRHLSLPQLSIPVAISGLPTVNRVGRAGTFYPLGAGKPIVTAWPRSGREGELTLLTINDAQRRALLALLADGTPLQLAVDSSKFSFDENGAYITVTDVTEDRPVDTGDDAARYMTLTFIEVNAPVAAGAQGAITDYADLDAAFTSYASLKGAGIANGWTYRDLLDGTALS